MSELVETKSKELWRVRKERRDKGGDYGVEFRVGERRSGVIGVIERRKLEGLVGGVGRGGVREEVRCRFPWKHFAFVFLPQRAEF